MQDRVEPPILLSRILTFVLATALVALLTLGITLYRLFPLNRPQVFFLTTQPSRDMEITLTEMVPNDKNFEIYKKRFIREYIRARNEYIPDVGKMRYKWNTYPDSVVFAWSTPDVYKDFIKTAMWTAVMHDMPDVEFKCQVEFQSDEETFEPRNSGKNDTYLVRFRYFCSSENEELAKKDYAIVVKLDFDTPTNIKWTERLDNPLGIRVAEYTIESGDGDPLDKVGVYE